MANQIQSLKSYHLSLEVHGTRRNLRDTISCTGNSCKTIDTRTVWDDSLGHGFHKLSSSFVQSGFNTALIQKKDADEIDFRLFLSQLRCFRCTLYSYF